MLSLNSLVFVVHCFLDRNVFIFEVLNLSFHIIDHFCFDPFLLLELSDVLLRAFLLRDNLLILFLESFSQLLHFFIFLI